jgi:hypothetical protein
VTKLWHRFRQTLASSLLEQSESHSGLLTHQTSAATSVGSRMFGFLARLVIWLKLLQYHLG